MRPNPVTGPLTHTLTQTQTNAHQGVRHPPTPLKLDSTLLALAHAHIGNSRRVSRDIVFAKNPLTPNTGLFYHITKTHMQPLFPNPPAPRYFNRDLVKTTFTRLLSSPDTLSLFLCVCVMKSVNNV